MMPIILFTRITAGRRWNGGEVAAVIGMEADICKARWRTLRDSFVKHERKSSVGSGSTTGTQKEWKYNELMSFLTPFLQPRRSKRSLQASTLVDVDGEKFWTPLSRAGSEEQSTTQDTLQHQRTASSPSPPRKSLSPSRKASETRGQHGAKESRKRSSMQVADLEERIISFLEEPPTKPHVPITEHDEAYHFALSTVPMLLSLNKCRRRRAKTEILMTLDRLNEEQEQEETAVPLQY
ncbi:uncharacterized protein LOC119787719 [Cyprinodon tularosa]|uniref:uncharacterized protein LOC119787719 n=1 Tax=Cyprinodon tularosa TaxID=77115 RepID=UPI0018E25194|nr:uncharacterized protein LOC119787719 [Cyprinodon tularosa]